MRNKGQSIFPTIEERKKEAFEKYSVFRVAFESGRTKLTGIKYIPEMDEGIPREITMLKDGFSSGRRIEVAPGIWNYNVRRYWDELVLIHDYLFSELSVLLSSKKVNYFKQKTGY